jgi:hypothetical protein
VRAEFCADSGENFSSGRGQNNGIPSTGIP